MFTAKVPAGVPGFDAPLPPPPPHATIVTTRQINKALVARPKPNIFPDFLAMRPDAARVKRIPSQR